jgi:MSHA pilin protein MshC
VGVRYAGRVEHRRNSRSGFSLVELVVIIAIAAVIAAVATARFVGKSGFESRAYFDEAIAVVRQAQKTAIAQRREVTVMISSDRIAVCYDTTCIADATKRVLTPLSLNRSGGTAAANCLNDATWLCTGRPDGVASIASTAASITFDGLGRPNTAATITISGTEAGDVIRTFVIEAETGYVHP